MWQERKIKCAKVGSRERYPRCPVREQSESKFFLLMAGRQSKHRNVNSSLHFPRKQIISAACGLNWDLSSDVKARAAFFHLCLKPPLGHPVLQFKVLQHMQDLFFYSLCLQIVRRLFFFCKIIELNHQLWTLLSFYILLLLIWIFNSQGDFNHRFLIWKRKDLWKYELQRRRLVSAWF